MIRVRWIALSFVMRQRCFPHIGMFSFLHRECINLHEGHLRNKMHLHSTWSLPLLLLFLSGPFLTMKKEATEKVNINISSCVFEIRQHCMYKVHGVLFQVQLLQELSFFHLPYLKDNFILPLWVFYPPVLRCIEWWNHRKALYPSMFCRVKWHKLWFVLFNFLMLSRSEKAY